MPVGGRSVSLPARAPRGDSRGATCLGGVLPEQQCAWPGWRGDAQRWLSARSPSPSRGWPSSVKPWEKARKRAFSGRPPPPSVHCFKYQPCGRYTRQGESPESYLGNLVHQTRENEPLCCGRRYPAQPAKGTPRLGEKERRTVPPPPSEILRRRSPPQLGRAHTLRATQGIPHRRSALLHPFEAQKLGEAAHGCFSPFLPLSLKIYYRIFLKTSKIYSSEKNRVVNSIYNMPIVFLSTDMHAHMRLFQQQFPGACTVNWQQCLCLGGTLRVLGTRVGQSLFHYIL